MVQGASRGIGAALTKYYLENTSVRVLATARNPTDPAGILYALQDKFGPDRLSLQRLDVLDEESIRASAGK
jgi:NADP-dependent 3-hydroxy acid dehydrogenase YdfG